jgi:sarcinarray family protein
LKIKVLILLSIIFINGNSVIAEPVEKEYGIVNAWYNGNEATVENVQLKINEPIEIKVEVTSKINGHVAIYLDNPLVSESYKVLSGPGQIEKRIDALNVEPGWTEIYIWKIAPSGEWTNGNAPINIFVQFTKTIDDHESIEFTIANPYILDEHYSGPAPTRTAAPSSTDQPASEESPGFCALAAIPVLSPTAFF